MPAMKLTPNTAMRARDVSRPRAEHLAEAEAAEAKGSARRDSTGPAERRGADRGGLVPDAADTGRIQTGSADTGGAVTGDDRAGRAGVPRRRRGPRDGGRRGRSSR